MRGLAPAFLVALAFAALAAEASARPVVPAVHRAVARTPITHVISILQENHTYDNYFGTYHRGNGLPKGVCMPIDPKRPKRGCQAPFHIGDNGIVPRDLDHSAETARRQVRGGRMDGFVSALLARNQNGRLAMGYRDGRDLPYYWNLADEYVLFDRFFSSAGAGSFLNHVYWVSASAAGGYDRMPPGGYKNLTTIFDRLEAAGVSWKFYVQNYEPRLNFRTLSKFPGNRASQVIWVPLLNIPRFLDDPKLFSHIVDMEQYFTDLHNGTLPAVSYIAPSGPSEHPPSSLASGQSLVRSLINALVQSSSWKKSAFLLAYDDWGGWYDHVRPPRVDRHGYGLRVPALLVSPYARRGVVDHTTLDFTSILKFIEQNWGLKPLAQRDARANSFAAAFDFEQPARAPAFTAPTREQAPDARARRPVIYAMYLGALGFAALLIVWAAVPRAGRGRPSPDDPRVEGETA
jgi:phospholipase C